MKIMVTGSAGFIGSNLVKKLLEEGHEVTGVDNFSTGKNNIDHKNFESINADIKTIDWDFCDLGFYDQIYHLAAVVGVRRVLENPLECIETNLDGTKRLLDALTGLEKAPKLFIASTSEVYGKNEKREFSETDDCVVGSTLKSRWSYAITKMMDELVAQEYAKKYKLDIVIGRLFSVVGRGQVSDYGMVIPKLVSQAIQGDDITVYGDGTQVRSFMDVNDCINCITRIMDSEFSGVINIGNTESISIKELAWRIKHLSNSKSEINLIPYTKAYNDEGFDEMYFRRPNIDKLTIILGGKPLFTTLDNILLDVIQEQKNK